MSPLVDGGISCWPELVSGQRDDIRADDNFDGLVRHCHWSIEFETIVVGEEGISGDEARGAKTDVHSWSDKCIIARMPSTAPMTVEINCDVTMALFCRAVTNGIQRPLNRITKVNLG
uniref:Uncharacterized protein n=1 Tax=Panagrellus redivivus TaxID=6233 RepID=A0A7E4VWP6_PANRE